MADVLHKELSFAVIGAAMEVHSFLGPGYPEQVYQVSLEHELALRGIPFVAQCQIKVPYKSIIAAEYYLDFLIDNKIVVELKAVSSLMPVHQSQVISYLKATGLAIGLLFNFGEQSLIHKRIIYKHGK